MKMYVFPIKNGDFPACHVGFRGCKRGKVEEWNLKPPDDNWDQKTARSWPRALGRENCQQWR